MTEQAFTIHFEGPELNDETLDRFFEAGCDDAAFGSRNGSLFAQFDREAETLADAVSTAIRDLTSADRSLRIRGFEPASPVSQSAIAERVGLSREAVRLMAAGKRGPRDFPRPLFFSGRVPLYSWSESHRWLNDLDHVSKVGWDPASELALETLSGLLRLADLSRSWTPETQDRIQTILRELPRGDPLRRWFRTFERELAPASSKSTK
jgi:hypothetical protein